MYTGLEFELFRKNHEKVPKVRLVLDIVNYRYTYIDRVTFMGRMDVDEDGLCVLCLCVVFSFFDGRGR